MAEELRAQARQTKDDNDCSYSKHRDSRALMNPRNPRIFLKSELKLFRGGARRRGTMREKHRVRAYLRGTSWLSWNQVR